MSEVHGRNGTLVLGDWLCRLRKRELNDGLSGGCRGVAFSPRDHAVERAPRCGPMRRSLMRAALPVNPRR